MRNYPQTIVSQYAASPTLGLWVDAINQYFDPSANLQQFYDQIWNVSTAQGYGLDVWGRIVGVQRVLQVSAGSYLGFEEAADTTLTPFNVAPFYTGQPTTSNYTLSDQAFRLLIMAKAAANICFCSAPAINAILLLLFPNRGNCYVTDGRNMTMTYTFTFPLQPWELAIVQTSGVVPRPAGVFATVVHP